MPSSEPAGAVEVREARLADLEEAERLLRSEIAYDPKWHRDLDDLRGAYLDDPGQALFVARAPGAGGALAGTAVIRKRMPNVQEVARRLDAAVSCELGRVTVAPAWRRRGVAILLTEAARAWAHQHGYRTLHLHTDPGNAPALALWRSIADEVPRLEYREGESVYFELPIALPVRRRTHHPDA